MVKGLKITAVVGRNTVGGGGRRQWWGRNTVGGGRTAAVVGEKLEVVGEEHSSSGERR